MKSAIAGKQSNHGDGDSAGALIPQLIAVVGED
jgi:hypothetical protein